jgi:hypothetical protein
VLLYGLSREIITEGNNLIVKDFVGVSYSNITTPKNKNGLFCDTGLVVYSNDDNAYSLEYENTSFSFSINIQTKSEYSGGVLVRFYNASAYYKDKNGIGVEDLSITINDTNELAYYVYYYYLLKNIVQFKSVKYLPPLSVIAGDDGNQYKTITCEVENGVYYYIAVRREDFTTFKNNIIVEYFKNTNALTSDVINVVLASNLGNPINFQNSFLGRRVNPKSHCFRTWIYEDDNTLVSTLNKKIIPTIVQQGNVGGITVQQLYLYGSEYAKNNKLLFMYPPSAELINVYSGSFVISTYSYYPFYHYTNTTFSPTISLDLQRDVLMTFYYTSANTNVICKDGWKFFNEYGVTRGGVVWKYSPSTNVLDVRLMVECNIAVPTPYFYILQYRLPTPDFVYTVENLTYNQNTTYFITELPTMPSFLEVWIYTNGSGFGSQNYYGEDILLWQHEPDVSWVQIGFSGSVIAKVIKRENNKINLYLRTFSAPSYSQLSSFNVYVRAWWG